MSKFKKIVSAEEAIKDLKDGMTIMVGGFYGVGAPELLCDAIVAKGVKNLTVICNDTSFCVGTKGREEGRGVGKLISAGAISHVITTHIGLNPKAQEQEKNGSLKVTFVPMGNLLEKIRAGAYGLGAVVTPTGVGTDVETNLDENGDKKETITVNGRKYLVEKPLHADFSFVKASVADEFGNYYNRRTAKNVNYMMTGAANCTVLEVEKLVDIDSIDPDRFQIPGVLVNKIVKEEQ